jgi:bifunctional non-homologous end joining protein LigD
MIRRASSKRPHDSEPKPSAAPVGQVITPSGSGGTVVLGLAISHPDKALWPDAGDGQAVSKLELARYFEAVGAWTIEHVRGRPCSIVRAPDGLSGEHFFQRHATRGMSRLIEQVRITGDRQPYIQVDRIEALIALAQFDTLEIHPWNSVPGDPDRPGRLIFDLDPDPAVPFDLVIDAAREMRQRLSDVGLNAFCKTTGGKGLHVVVPLASEPDATWPMAKEFTHAICVKMARDSPDSYVVNMAKSRRKGRIFLDYLRNDRFATAVAPLSPRARPGATVSLPMEWTEVKIGLDPTRFTVRTSPPLLRNGKAWAGYFDAAAPLRVAIERSRD